MNFYMSLVAFGIYQAGVDKLVKKVYNTNSIIKKLITN